jgi:hypothetical protein
LALAAPAFLGLPPPLLAPPALLGLAPSLGLASSLAPPVAPPLLVVIVLAMDFRVRDFCRDPE